MYEHIKQGNSLNKAIEEINKTENNKQNSGITGYLTNGLYNKEDVDKDAIISSMISFIYYEQRKKLNNYIKESKWYNEKFYKRS